MVAGDGGTIWLALVDAAGKKHTLWIPQYHIQENFSPEYPPGSLVFDGALMETRGKDEERLVGWLQTADVKPMRTNTKGMDIHNREITLPPYTAVESEKMGLFIRDVVKDVIAFVKSDAYLALAEKYGK
jgi:hypothetical protein